MRSMAHARWSFPALLGLLLTGTPLTQVAAQGADSTWRGHSPALVRYGKWALLGAAIGMGIKASQVHRDADRAYAQLRRYCNQSALGCAQDGDGTYLEPQAEQYYQTSVSRDNQARRWLLGGEISLVGAVGLFVWELSRPKRPPGNIPFEPEFQVLPHQTRFGVNVAF